jgi:hypothetical protein
MRRDWWSKPNRRGRCALRRRPLAGHGALASRPSWRLGSITSPETRPPTTATDTTGAAGQQAPPRDVSP